jgi:hypothetical protein
MCQESPLCAFVYIIIIIIIIIIAVIMPDFFRGLQVIGFTARSVLHALGHLLSNSRYYSGKLNRNLRTSYTPKPRFSRAVL